jgi:rubrerythrin
MGVLEELKAKYPWHNVPPYGDCIVVGVSDWQTQWGPDLKLQNVRAISTTYKGLPVYLIPLKDLPHDLRERTNASNPAPSTSTEPLKSRKSTDPTETRKPRRRSDWQPDENDRLVKLWKEGVQVPKMAKYFPNRTVKAIRQELTELIRRGIIKARWHKRKSGEAKARTRVSRSAESREIAPGVPGNEIRDALARLKKLLQETTLHIHDSSKPFTFKWHCPKCGYSGEAKAAEVWQTCQICKGPLIVWDVE